MSKKEFKGFNVLEEERQYLITTKREEVEKLHKHYELLQEDKRKEIDKLNKQFEKEVRSYFKGIKINIKHNKYEFEINSGNGWIFRLDSRVMEHINLDCFYELIDLYEKYYGKPQEKKITPYAPYKPQTLSQEMLNKYYVDKPF